MKRRVVAGFAACSPAPLAACNATKQAERGGRRRAPCWSPQSIMSRARARRRCRASSRRASRANSRFRVGGRIERRLVDAGAFVHKGDALAQLDETDFQLQLEQAEAERRSARAALDAGRGRGEARHRAGAVRAGRRTPISTRPNPTADQARRAVDRAERAVSLASNALDYATLTADADGVVSAVEAEPGQVVAAGAPVVRLAHTDEKEAAVADAREPGRARARRQGARRILGAAGRPTAAKLRELSPNADPATRTYAARFSLPDAPAGARLGMSVTVALADGAPDARARAARRGVRRSAQGPSVWVVDRGDRRGRRRRRSSSPPATPNSAYRRLAASPEGAEIVALGVHKIDAQREGARRRKPRGAVDGAASISRTGGCGIRSSSPS